MAVSAKVENFLLNAKRIAASPHSRWLGGANELSRNLAQDYS
jgi:hypothetical protein